MQKNHCDLITVHCTQSVPSFFISTLIPDAVWSISCIISMIPFLNTSFVRGYEFSIWFCWIKSEYFLARLLLFYFPCYLLIITTITLYIVSLIVVRRRTTNITDSLREERTSMFKMFLKISRVFTYSLNIHAFLS